MKTTMSMVKARCSNIVRVGYCDLYYTLHEVSPLGENSYTSGVYGWNADIFEFDSFTIVTGYRPFGNLCLDYDFCKKWEEKAKAHNAKVYAKLPTGKYRTPLARNKMFLTFKHQFENAVWKEIEKQRKGKKTSA